MSSTRILTSLPLAIAGNHVVEAAVTDVVGSTVTTDDPLTALHDVLLQVVEAGADGTLILGSFQHGHDALVDVLRLVGIQCVVQPFLEDGLVFGGSSFVGNAFLHQLGDALAQFLVGQFHTQTKFAEVLEQGVCPCRTVTFLVLRVRRGRYGAGVDGGATRGVGHHLAVTKQLADELHVRGFAAAGACAGELEQRRSELAVLHVGLDVYQVLFALHVGIPSW